MRDWSEHLENSFPTVVPLLNNFTHTTDPILDLDISLTEINISLSKCKRNKSPGLDGISNEFLIALTDNWKLYLVSLFN